MTYQFKIELANISNPKVWRRITVPGDYTFYDLHFEIQDAFGWENDHLFEFSVKQKGSLLQIGIENPFGFGEETSDAEEICLSEIFTDKKIRCTYTYDFGDNWEHHITVEKIIKDETEEAEYIEGEGACPPEDCGGPYGYENLKRILADKSHPEYPDRLEWLGLEDGSEWDPNKVDNFSDTHLKFDIESMNPPIEDLPTVEVIPEMVPQSTQMPQFNHPEVTIFYEVGAKIDREKLHQIMGLPRTTLIQDMEKMLIDAIARYEYYDKLEWTDETHSFPLHALYVLSALEAEEALETLFTFMRQTEEFYDLWLADLLTDDFWHFIYHLGQKRLDQLKNFILEPNRYTYTRCAVSNALLQIGLHQPDHKQEVISWLESVIKILDENRDNVNLFDDTLFSSMICDLFDIGDEAQLSFIEQYYAKNLIDEMYVGSFQALKKDFATRISKDYHKAEIFTTIDQFYDEWLGWAAAFDEHSNYLRNEAFETANYLYKEPTPYIAEPKVGRNDPCPCGSGKKYKKCCGAN